MSLANALVRGGGGIDAHGLPASEEQLEIVCFLEISAPIGTDGALDVVHASFYILLFT